VLFPLRIFISYAAQDREPAKSIYLALRDQGQQVFFDRVDLPAGDEYHNRIRKAIQKSHLFIFLLSPNALDADSYTLEELSIAEKAGIKLLPVVLREPAMEQVPVSLKHVTFHRPVGNVAASVATEVHRLAGDRTRKRLKGGAAVLSSVTAVAVGFYFIHEAWNKGNLFGKDGAPAVLIPAASFIMGDDEDSPRRDIYLDAFYMDRYEVTVSRYAKFLTATGNVQPPEEWPGENNVQVGDLPVVGVDWWDANSYCRWADRRLPTEAEWERAARGSDDRKYPWGNDAPRADQARFGRSYQDEVYKGGVAQVGTHAKDQSPFGVYDLAGNVSEWVADWYADSFSRADVRNPTGPATGVAKVLRGGGWYDSPDRLTTTKRWQASPDHRSDEIGFRCARDVK
jgi:formylglycine-generating enzyme required for sulfatase activity